MAHDARSVAQYLLWLGRDSAITPMQLLKLVYISHGWMLANYGRPLISDVAEAWQYGPVIPSVYRAYKGFGGSAITDVPLSEPQGFGDEEKDLMQQVWAAYRNFTGLQLSALTHQPGTPWEVTRRLCGRGARISNDLIEEHYRSLRQRS